VSGAWLQLLAVGDEVIVPSGLGSVPGRLARVERVTAKQIIVGNERYWRDGGRIVGSGGSWYSRALQEATPALRQAAIRYRHLEAVRHAPWHLASDDVLAQVAALIPPTEPRGRAG
jgi:hypothetical protein